MAVHSGSTETLEWVIENIPGDFPILNCIACLGNIEMFKWAEKKGHVTSDPKQLVSHMALAQRNIQPPSHVDPRALIYDTRKKVKMLKFLRGHGFPWDKSVVQLAANLSDEYFLNYLIEHGCPCPKLDRAIFEHHQSFELGAGPLVSDLSELLDGQIKFIQDEFEIMRDYVH
jgi:hypothetical protein